MLLTPGEPGRRPLRVVVADDAVLLREGLVRLLAEDGHQVVAAVGDGPALVGAVLAHRPDVSVVDVRMPPTHTDEGLRAALAALAARSTIRAELDAGPLDQRLDPAAETAAYFVIAEALANAAKHSHAHRCVIGLRHGHRTLRVWLTDDGVGGAALVKGHGLRGLDHRLHAVGGRLTVTSPSGGPTTIAAELPCC